MSTPASARSGSGASSLLRWASTRPVGWSRSPVYGFPRCAGAGSLRPRIRRRRKRRRRENREAIEEAAALDAATLVLVPGGLPPGDRDLQAARDRAARAIERLVPYAHELGVNLGIEPMNPIYAADRGVISTLAQALDIAERFEPEDVGVVVDTFHLWWEPGIAEQVQRAGPRIVSYQICDWITPLPPDTLLARGMVGDGHIDFAAFTRSVAKAGYRGDIEVEIFNADLWAAPPAEVVEVMAGRYLELVQPYLDSDAP